MLCVLLVIFVCIIFNNNVLPKLLNCFLCYLCMIISFWASLIYSLKVSTLEYFLNSKEHILRGSFLATLVLSSSKRGRLWNQGLVNLDFDDNKTRFRTNDHISSVIRQDDFQSAIQRQIKPRRNHEEEDHLKEKSFSRPKLLKNLFVRLLVH